MSQIQDAVQVLSTAVRAVALTGAGISVESGIPPFRGKGGLWEKIDPMRYAHIDAFVQDPAKVWKVLFLDMHTLLAEALPNPGHVGIYRLEQMGILKTVITQNVDGLHQKAGSRDVIEFHGTFAVIRCTQCGETCDGVAIVPDHLPPRCRCGGILRPDVVLFGEQIGTDNLMRAQVAAAQCDVMLVVGTSATVEPAAYLPVIAKRGGAVIIEINPEATPLSAQGISDLVLLGPAGAVMTQLIDSLHCITIGQ
jgi:NAD-dependent deacetylase